jgi:hypothetical protein
MVDLLKIAMLERQTLTRGLLVSFLLSLPFFFIPTLFKHGFIAHALLDRTPVAALYAFLFSLFILMMALVQNYQSLRIRKFLFDKPAFTSLDFYGRVDGVGSIAREVETFLIGKIGSHYFRLNLVDPEESPFKVEIVPFISPDDQQRKILVSQHSFGQRRFFGVEVDATEDTLDDQFFLSTKLEEMDRLLSAKMVASLVVHESDL